MISSLASSLVALALAAAPHENVPGCPAGYVCIEERCAAPCRPACGEARCCEPEAAGAEAGQAVPAVAHREAHAAQVAPASSAAPAASSGTPAVAPASGETRRATSRSGFSQWAVGVEAGLNFGSTMWLDPDPGLRTDHETESAPTFLVFADSMTSRTVSVGGILYSTSLDGNFGDASVLGVGATLKARYQTRSNLQLRPGVLLSYQKVDVDTMGGAAKGLGVGLLLDVAAPLGDSFGIVTTLGVLGQPAGGNDDADVTFGPAFFWTGGIEFGS